MSAASAKFALPGWLRPAPDSLWREADRYSDRGRLQLCNYLWSAWAFTALFYQPPSASFWWALGLGQLVFSAVFLLIYLRPRREIPAYACAIALLAYVAVFWNHSAWAYLVFACVYIGIAHVERPWVGIAWMAGLQGVLVAISLPYVDWMVILMVLGVCSAIGIGNMFGYMNKRRSFVLRQSQDEVRRLATANERERIGRDLHDLLGHSLSLITMKLELSRKLIDRDPDRAREELRETEAVARTALTEVRAAVSGMRAPDLAAELASARVLMDASGIDLVETWGDCELPPAREQGLALALREAMTNIARHSGATRAELHLHQDDDGVCLRVRDDGRGGVSKHGNGLAGMRERIQGLGGALRLESPRGGGTLLEIRLSRPRDATTRKTDDAAAPASARNAGSQTAGQVP